MKKIQLLILIFSLHFLQLDAISAPMPGMGSSILSSRELSLPFLLKKFKLDLKNTDWITHVEPSVAGEVNLRLSHGGHSAFTVKTETLTQPLTLESYSRKWVKEYLAFGFEILGSKSFVQDQAKGIVVDLFHKKTEKQLRQVVFLKDKNSVILTCADKKESFPATLLSCNSMIKTFHWVD